MWNSHENLLKCEKDAGFNYEGHKIQSLWSSKYAKPTVMCFPLIVILYAVIDISK